MNLEEVLRRMRDAGWMVAVHNDYRERVQDMGAMRIAQMTFWLFTRESGGVIYAVKGEDSRDLDAVLNCYMQAQRLDAALK